MNIASDSEGKLNELVETSPAILDIAALERACQMLEHVETCPELKEIRDKAEAIRQFARNAKMGLALQNKAAELKLRAERKAGAFLRLLSLHGGDRKSKAARNRPTLETIGISKKQSERWQLLSTVPDELFNEFIVRLNNNCVEITSAAGQRFAKQLRDSNGSDSSQAREIEVKNEASDSDLRDLVENFKDRCKTLQIVLEPLYETDDDVGLKIGQRKILKQLIREFERFAKMLESRLQE